jgi:hypothetical protein
MPFRIIPDLGQVSEYRVQPSTKQRCHVLQHGVLRSNHANGSNDFPVESRTGTGQSGACASEGNVLAWETRSDDIGLAFLKFVCGHVVMARNAGEILRQDALAIVVLLDEPYGLKPARPFEANGETSDACEHFQHAHLALRLNRLEL